MIRLPECPICGRTVPPASDPGANHSPFCSRRCKEVDLIRWCEGRYAIVDSVDSHRMAELAEQESESTRDEFSHEGTHDESENDDD
jgi:endogenous inhibitor of DNA gyrase (YacG/DUF329 family)